MLFYVLFCVYAFYVLLSMSANFRFARVLCTRPISTELTPISLLRLRPLQPQLQGLRCDLPQLLHTAVPGVLTSVVRLHNVDWNVQVFVLSTNLPIIAITLRRNLA